MNIEATIKAAVESSGKSQHELAKLSGLSQVAVHKFLKKGMHLSGDKLERLGRAAGVTITTEVNTKGPEVSTPSRSKRKRIEKESAHV